MDIQVRAHPTAPGTTHLHSSGAFRDTLASQFKTGTFSILFPTSSSMNCTPQQGSLELLAAEYVEQSPQIVTTAAGSLQFAPIRIPACSSEYTARFNPQNTFSRLILEITHVSNKKATIFSLQTGGQPHSCYTGKCQRGIFQLERGNTKGR